MESDFASSLEDVEVAAALLGKTTTATSIPAAVQTIHPSPYMISPTENKRLAAGIMLDHNDSSNFQNLVSIISSPKSAMHASSSPACLLLALQSSIMLQQSVGVKNDNDEGTAPPPDDLMESEVRQQLKTFRALQRACHWLEQVHYEKGCLDGIPHHESDTIQWMAET